MEILAKILQVKNRRRKVLEETHKARVADGKKRPGKAPAHLALAGLSAPPGSGASVDDQDEATHVASPPARRPQERRGTERRSNLPSRPLARRMPPMRRRLWLVALALVAAPLASRAADSLLLATTTSVQDTGLLDALLPDFTKRTGIQVRVVAVGSGAALRMGAQGDADVLLTHAPAGEEKLVKSGAVVSRTSIMENYFVLAGPEDDPANVRDAGSPEEAFRRIAARHAPYVSRADDSGTNRREREIFRSAGLDPDATWPGFVKTGTGMGLTLQVAGEKRAYVLSDIGTFLAFRDRTHLASLSKPAPALRNVYSVLRVNPERFPAVHADAARRFEAFFLDPVTQQRIAAFGRESHGQALFTPLRLAKSPSAPERSATR